MNRSQIVVAMDSDRPLPIRTADGKEFVVPTRDHIAISPKATFVQVFGDDESVTSMAMITMTSVHDTPVTEVGTG